MADLRRNGRIGKVFELAEPRFSRVVERDFRIRPIFPYCDRNRNRDRNHILNPWSQLGSEQNSANIKSNMFNEDRTLDRNVIES